MTPAASKVTAVVSRLVPSSWSIDRSQAPGPVLVYVYEMSCGTPSSSYIVTAVWTTSPIVASASRLPAMLPAVTPTPPVARGATTWP